MSTLYCSFCDKSQDEVEVMIAGLGVNICNECVELCGEMVAEYHDLKRQHADETEATQ